MLSLLLPLLAISPLLIKIIISHSPRLRSSWLLFIGPLVFLGLTLFSYKESTAIDFGLLKISSFFSLALKLDTLSGIICANVLTIGIIVIRYSFRHLEDDPNKNKFSNNLACTLSSVLFMLMSPNYTLFLISWSSTSYFLHNLLLHFRDKDGAQKAARQKFWVGRIGDVLLISSAIILYSVFKTLDFDNIFKLIQTPDFVKFNFTAINTASVFIALGAIAKSAQFPFHHWLPNTMETPTPVSALMHAGIINAGGYLVVRMSPLISTSFISLSLLAILGGFTAFYGAVMMFAQTNVKKSLAYSTISQMGFMMLQCGLGAFSIAVVHIIGHAFYKAYAFLSSGTASDFGKLNRYYPKQNFTHSFFKTLLMAIFSISVIFGAFSVSGFSVLERPGTSVLLVVLSLAVSQILLSTQDKIRSVIMAVLIVGIYLSLSFSMTQLLTGVAPNQTSNYGVLSYIIFFICVSFFVTLYFIQNNLDKISKTKIGKKAYVKALSGGL